MVSVLDDLRGVKRSDVVEAGAHVPKAVASPDKGERRGANRMLQSFTVCEKQMPDALAVDHLRRLDAHGATQLGR